MRKKLFIILLITIVLTGCTKLENNNALIRYDINKKYTVEIINGLKVKVINDDVDSIKIINYLNRIKLFKIDNYNSNLNFKNKFKIIIKDQSNEIIGYITITDNRIFNNGNWYMIENKHINMISKIYNSLNYDEKIEKKHTLINKGRDLRKKLPPLKALLGTWEDINGNKIKFNKDLINIDDKLYKYKIIRKSENSIYLKVYGLKGFFIKNENLFIIDIKFDLTRCNIVLNKTIKYKLGNDIKYRYEMIYINNGIEYGEFDSYFFYNEKLNKF